MPSVLDRIAKRINRNSHSSSTKTHVQEAYKIVRANLLFTMVNLEKNIITISSAEPDAGKSTTCANLAATMAQMGAKILIVDADMRRPTLHKIFRISNHVGLSKLIVREADLEDVIYRDTQRSHVDVIPSGPIPPNPSELLGSSRMVDFLHEVESQYDYIFLDTPPVNVVADALMMSDLVAGTLIVARQKQTRYDELKKAIEMFENLNAKILGVVITDVDWKYKPYARYKSYKYGAYYYERSKEGKKSLD